MALRFISAVAMLPGSMGHAEITWPPPLSQGSMDKAGTCKGPDPTQVPQNGTCLWFNQGCTIGCPVCVGLNVSMTGSTCDRPGTATLDPRYRTVINATLGNVTDPTAEHPWRAPGTAPVWSPCGLAGGSFDPDDGAGAGAWTPTGIKVGFDGRSLPPAPGPRTLWPAGSVQEVAWAMRANHGGGYSWRLCPRSANISEMGEECFQRQQLDFVGEVSWIQYGETAVPYGEANRTAVPAVRVVDGTFPKGSMWTRNPVPTCRGPFGGAQMHDGCEGPMFTPPIDAEDMPGVAERGLYGYGQARCTSRLPGKECDPEEYAFWGRRFNFNLVDLVQVPMLSAGDYVLALRWDCEQTPQIWSNCADVTIVAPEVHV
jgi:hypothetical protein